MRPSTGDGPVTRPPTAPIATPSSLAIPEAACALLHTHADVGAFVDGLLTRPSAARSTVAPACSGRYR